MKQAADLRAVIDRIDGRGYKAYREIKNSYDFGDYLLIIDHVQGDPFAAPSSIRVKMSQQNAGFPPDTYNNTFREIALRDFITRQFAAASRKFCRGRRGTGRGGIISIDEPGQEVLERTSAFINRDGLEIRFRVGLPAFGRSVAGKIADKMFFNELPQIVRSSLLYKSLNASTLYRHVEMVEDAEFLREEIEKRNLIAFVADGAVLPRVTGIDSRPLMEGNIVPFESPPSLRVVFPLPNSGNITGMGIPKGVTLIVGGGYHGKSTLLKALQFGIYNHVPEDGREFVVSNPQTVKIRAEDGRHVEKVDISPFISNLPFGRNTRAFCTDDASGSTSQATNIIEALEAGAEVLIMDEDTSATNFMIRDHRMQELVSKDREPITPFIDKIRQLYQDYGISTVLAIGGSGDYFDVADHVVCMVEYRPHDLTSEARAIAEKYKSQRGFEGGAHFGATVERIPIAGSFNPRKGKREVKISSKGLKTIDFGHLRIDLGALEQLVDVSQTRAIGDAIQYATRYMDGERKLGRIIQSVLGDIQRYGLDVLSDFPIGEYAVFRGMELAAAINRMRTLSVKQDT
jgi:predicted ABC-class ATPase